jgi:hypothetical protein
MLFASSWAFDGAAFSPEGVRAFPATPCVHVCSKSYSACQSRLFVHSNVGKLGYTFVAGRHVASVTREYVILRQEAERESVNGENKRRNSVNKLENASCRILHRRQSVVSLQEVSKCLHFGDNYLSTSTPRHHTSRCTILSTTASQANRG